MAVANFDGSLTRCFSRPAEDVGSPRYPYSRALSAQNSLQKNRLSASHALIPIAVNGSGSRQEAQYATDLEERPGLGPKPAVFGNGLEGAARSLRIAVPVEAMLLS
jgi:hypothetical protein